MRDPFNKLLHAKSLNNLKALRIFADVKGGNFKKIHNKKILKLQ